MAADPPVRFRYALDQWPPPLATLVLSLQCLVALLPGVLVLGDVLATAQGLDAAARVEFLQRLMLMSGLVQAAQVLLGHRLPGLVGPSAVLSLGMLMTLGAGLASVQGALVAGGLMTALAGATGLAGRLGRLYTPPVLASTLLLLMVGLAPAMRDLMFDPGQGEGSPSAAFAFALALVLAMIGVQRRAKGLLSSSVLLLGMVAGSAVYYLAGLGRAPGFAAGAAAPLGWPDLMPRALELEPGVIASFCLCYLALIANELASVEALGPITGAQGMPRRSSRAVLFSGLGGVLGGMWGVPGPVTYSHSPGVVFASNSASRWTLLPAALIVAALSAWPQGLALVRWAPPAVVGAVLFALMASSVQAALHLLVNQGRGLDPSSGLVMGAAVIAGLLVTFMPPVVRESLPPLLRPLLANGFVVGLALALVLEHLILRRPDGQA